MDFARPELVPAPKAHLLLIVPFVAAQVAFVALFVALVEALVEAQRLEAAVALVVGFVWPPQLPAPVGGLVQLGSRRLHMRIEASQEH